MVGAGCPEGAGGVGAGGVGAGGAAGGGGGGAGGVVAGGAGGVAGGGVGAGWLVGADCPVGACVRVGVNRYIAAATRTAITTIHQIWVDLIASPLSQSSSDAAGQRLSDQHPLRMREAGAEIASLGQNRHRRRLFRIGPV